MISVDDFNEVKDCVYKDEHYSVRDNGAVMRHPREGKRIRKDDNVWTFGKPNEKTGYMEIAGQRVHRIVAFAFHGNPPTEQHVVDHIDTNRRNNRPENLRWLTRLENALNNPITRARIENICGSIEVFLADPSILQGHEKTDPNFNWMRAVSPEEARTSLERLTNWAKEHPKPQGGSLGEWIFQDRKSTFLSYSPMSPKQKHITPEPVTNSNKTQSLTPNAVQIGWRTPSEFPCCPKELTDNPLKMYQSNLEINTVFCRNNLYNSLVVDSAIVEEGTSLWVMTRNGEEHSIKPWALSRVTYKDGIYFHESKGTFFEEKGALKYFTLAQGKEWTGGEVFDDFC